MSQLWSIFHQAEILSKYCLSKGTEFKAKGYAPLPKMHKSKKANTKGGEFHA